MIFRILSGNSSARSSIDVPPSEQATRTGPAAFLSSRIARYISLASSSFLAINRVLTGLPAGPDCLVTKVPPSILLATSGASLASQTWTPPWNPLVNFPRPRPPARIWDLTTTWPSLADAMALAAAGTSEREWTGMPGGTLTPRAAMTLAPCRFCFCFVFWLVGGALGVVVEVKRR